MLRVRVALLGVVGATLLFTVRSPEALRADKGLLKATVKPVAIAIDNFSYSPSTVVVAPGTTVTWTNHDDDVHTVVEKDRKFKSAGLDTDDAFSTTFTAPGEYEYFCSIHPRMVGKIIVKGAGS